MIWYFVVPHIFLSLRWLVKYLPKSRFNSELVTLVEKFPCLWSFCSLFMWDIKGAACVSSNFHKISKIGLRRRRNQSCFVLKWNHIVMVCWRREGFFFLPPAKLWDRIQYLGPTVSSNKTEESNILDLQWKRSFRSFAFYTESVNSEEVSSLSSSQGNITI